MTTGAPRKTPADGIHIRVVTPVIPTGLTHQEDFEGILSAPDYVTFTELDEGPESVESARDIAHAAPDSICKMINAEEIGADAIVIDCMAEPGLDGGREAVPIPVLGPCSTSMSIAAGLGKPFSMLTIARSMNSIFEAKARLIGLQDRMASLRSVDIPVAKLADDRTLLIDRLIEQALAAVVEDGTGSIILGCTGMNNVAEAVQRGLREKGHAIPVIDPIPMTIQVARALVATKQNFSDQNSSQTHRS